jgi:hypothetical protein
MIGLMRRTLQVGWLRRHSRGMTFLMDGQKYEGAGVMWGTPRYSSIDVSSFVEEAMIIISVFRISMKRLKWLHVLEASL